MRLLLIDDHALLRDGLILLLKRYDKNISVVQASNLAEAQAALLDSTKPIDLVLLDLRLEDQNSPETVISRIMALCRDIPVVVISGATDPRLVRGAIEQGAMAFIPKSLAFQELSIALTRVLEGEIYLPSTAFVEPAAPALGTRPAPQEALNRLSPRQMEILRLAVYGFSNQRVGEKLGIAEGTVKTHMVQIFRTLRVKNRVEAVYLLAQAEGRQINPDSKV